MQRPPENKRKTARLHHEIPVAYRTVGSFLTDWATNISQGGIFINTRAPLPVGTEVRILIQLPGASFPYQLSGRVARVTEYDNRANLVPGMALEFTDVDDAKRRDLEAFVNRLRHQLDEA
jgi:type IV pilus assembly protein PilZ